MEERTLFKNVSSLGEKESEALMKEAGKLPLIIMCVVLPLFCAVVGGLFLLLDDLGMAIWMFAFAVVIAIIYPPTYIVMTRKANKKFVEDKRVLNTYEFKEDFFNIVSDDFKSGEKFTIGTSNIIYKDLRKVVITNGYIFIFVNPSKSFVVDINGMLEGTSEDLITFLKEKISKIQDKRKVKKIV